MWLFATVGYIRRKPVPTKLCHQRHHLLIDVGGSGESGGKSDEQRRQNARTYVPLDLERDSMVSTVYRAVPSTRVARTRAFFKKARALFLSSSTR